MTCPFLEVVVSLVLIPFLLGLLFLYMSVWGPCFLIDKVFKTRLATRFKNWAFSKLFPPPDDDYAGPSWYSRSSSDEPSFFDRVCSGFEKASEEHEAYKERRDFFRQHGYDEED